MEFVSLGILLLLAFFAGVIGALLGLGGGFIIVPALTLLLGIPIHLAIGASFIGVLTNSSTASSFYLKQGLANLRIASVLEVGAVVGAVAGALVSLSLDQNLLGIVFGLALLYAAFSMYKSGERSEETKLASAASTNPAPVPHDPKGADLVYDGRRIRAGLILSLIGGGFSGSLGLGGGAVLVPILNRIIGLPVRYAVATSTLVIGVTAAAGALIFASRGSIDPSIALPVAFGVFFGAQLGSKIGSVVRSVLIRNVFIISLGYIALNMIANALGIGLVA